MPNQYNIHIYKYIFIDWKVNGLLKTLHIRHRLPTDPGKLDG